MLKSEGEKITSCERGRITQFLSCQIKKYKILKEMISDYCSLEKSK